MFMTRSVERWRYQRRSSARNCFAGMFWLGLRNRRGEKLEQKSNCMYRQADLMPRMVIKVQETMLLRDGKWKGLNISTSEHDLFNKLSGEFMIS